MKNDRTTWGRMLCLVWAVVWVGACASDDSKPNDGDRPPTTGAACEAASDCYAGVDPETIQGEIQCLDRVQGGYCTHLCASDDDCCAVEGECSAGIREVCSPFESTDMTMCLLSCEKEDLVPAPGAPASDPVDDNEYCQREAGPSFHCRSSGGGSANRKVCMPGDCGDMGSACAADGDCTGSLTCLTAFNGGYCGMQGCTANGDCPSNAACATHSNGNNYCYKICDTDVDCSFCRRQDTAPSCNANASLVEAGDVLVCEPVGL